MSFTTYQNAVRSFFDSGMATDAASTKIWWEGSTEGPQLGGSTSVVAKPQPGDAAWCSVKVQTVNNPELSSAYTGHLGAVIVSCFSTVKPGGNEAAESLADTVEGIFKRGSALAGALEFGRVRVNEVGPDGEGWYQVNVRAEFQHIEAA